MPAAAEVWLPQSRMCSTKRIAEPAEGCLVLLALTLLSFMM